MARYYNIVSKMGATTGKTFLQISECNSAGTVITTGGVHSSAVYSSISYVPTVDAEHFILRTDNGKKLSIPFTWDNVVKLEGVLHGAGDSYDLYIAIRSLIEI